MHTNWPGEKAFPCLGVAAERRWQVRLGDYCALASSTLEISLGHANSWPTGIEETMLIRWLEARRVAPAFVYVFSIDA